MSASDKRELLRFAGLLAKQGIEASVDEGFIPELGFATLKARVGTRDLRLSKNISSSTPYKVSEVGSPPGKTTKIHGARTIYEAEQIFAQLVAKYRGRKLGPVGERDERYRVPLPNPRRNPAARPIRAAKMIESGFSEARPGGVYIRPEKGVAPRDSEILNGRVYAGGFVDVSGPRPALFVSDEPATIPRMVGQKLSRVAGRFQAKVNLYRQSAGWEWESGARPTSDVEGSPAIVSVESPKGHHYALRVEFETPVWLATYPRSKSEPRLRPTALPGLMVVGEPVGTMVTTEKEHPVYDVIKLREPEPRAPRAPRRRR